MKSSPKYRTISISIPFKGVNYIVLMHDRPFLLIYNVFHLAKLEWSLMVVKKLKPHLRKCDLLFTSYSISCKYEIVFS